MSDTQVRLSIRMIAGIAAALLWSLSAHADTLSLSFASPSQTGSPGDTLVFFGTISNPGTTTIFLNGDTLSTGEPFLFGNDSAFIPDTPASLAAGASTGNVDLFSVTIEGSAAPGTYMTNNFLKITGGADSKFTTQDLLAAQTFSITVSSPSSVPEPGTMILFATGITGCMTRLVKRPRRG